MKPKTPIALLAVALGLAVGGCTAPIGADRVTTRRAYGQVRENALGKGDGDLQHGRDGVVAYTSAHVDYADSELLVRGGHSCQSLPVAIEEIQRILHEHLNQIGSQPNGSHKANLHKL